MFCLSPVPRRILLAPSKMGGPSTVTRLKIRKISLWRMVLTQTFKVTFLPNYKDPFAWPLVVCLLFPW
jgi:hypothetical protein